MFCLQSMFSQCWQHSIYHRAVINKEGVSGGRWRRGERGKVEQMDGQTDRCTDSTEAEIEESEGAPGSEDEGRGQRTTGTRPASEGPSQFHWPQGYDLKTPSLPWKLQSPN